MKPFTAMLIFAAFIAACIITTTDAWTMPSRLVESFTKTAAAVSISAAILTSPAANAVDFSGSFSDPFHPNCQRVVTARGAEATVKGTDGNPGCPADGSGKQWSLSGKIDVDTIVVDFSPKGGPSGLKGTWETGGKEMPAGIRWQDGNRWTLKEGIN